MGIETWEKENLVDMLYDQSCYMCRENAEKNEQYCYWLGVKMALSAIRMDTEIAQKAKLLAMICECLNETQNLNVSKIMLDIMQ